MSIEIVFIVIISYLIGSIPWAYFIVKLFERKDIRKLGTGNVGAMNSYESSGKKVVGSLVLLMDLLKGFSAIWLTCQLFSYEFTGIILSATSVILGHNYSIFLKFKGGRGLASGAGVALYLNPIFIFVWLILYFAGRKTIKDHVHAGAIFATIFSPVVIYFLPANWVEFLMMTNFISAWEYFLVSTALSSIILLKHIKPFIDLLKGNEPIS